MKSYFARSSRLIQGAVTLSVLAGFSAASCAQNAPGAPVSTNRRFDFGNATSVPGYVVVEASTLFAEQRGYGWLAPQDLATRDRQKPDDLRQDFIMGKGPATFRVTGLKPGRYLLTVVSGDMDYGDHVTRVKVAGDPVDPPLLAPRTREFAALTASITATESLDITFDSPTNNWAVNALSLEPTTSNTPPLIVSQQIQREPVKSTWDPQVFQNDPTKPLLNRFLRESRRTPRDFRPTGLTRQDYLKLLTSEVDFWKKYQNANGAIIDPYKKEEWQYSTPGFAHAAAALAVWGQRVDLLEPAAKAMDWATHRLSLRQAATSHEDFYPVMLGQALVLLKPRVAPERAARWEAELGSYDPYSTYRQAMGSMNWNIVALSGEALLQQLGIRKRDIGYVQDSLAAQGHHFRSPYGLYLEGPMAYDLLPRMDLSLMLAHGYQGPYRTEIDEAMRRGAITSLFMQSPWGELPAGHRSAHHQWNETIECVTFEIYAAQALREGNKELAGVFKRAAHLALASNLRWKRPSGELQIIKNWVDPEQRHAFEPYSAHSQYNMWPASMLATAYEYAAATEAVTEHPAPADVGGYVLEISHLHKVFANASGTYIEIDANADHHYDATGLIRVHMKGISPQLGPSDSLVSHSNYHSPQLSPVTTGIGVSWKDQKDVWHTLGETNPNQWKVTTRSASPERVVFDVTYEGDLTGATRVVEHYIVTPQRVEISTDVVGNTGPLRYLWPVLADDGRTQSTIKVGANTVSVSQGEGKASQTFTARGAQSVRVEEPRYSNHNGWARLAVAEYPQGGKVMLSIAPR